MNNKRTHLLLTNKLVDAINLASISLSMNKSEFINTLFTTNEFYILTNRCKKISVSNDLRYTNNATQLSDYISNVAFENDYFKSNINHNITEIEADKVLHFFVKNRNVIKNMTLKNESQIFDILNIVIKESLKKISKRLNDSNTQSKLKNELNNEEFFKKIYKAIDYNAKKKTCLFSLSDEAVTKFKSLKVDNKLINDLNMIYDIHLKTLNTFYEQNEKYLTEKNLIRNDLKIISRKIEAQETNDLKILEDRLRLTKVYDYQYALTADAFILLERTKKMTNEINEITKNLNKMSLTNQDMSKEIDKVIELLKVIAFKIHELSKD